MSLLRNLGDSLPEGFATVRTDERVYGQCRTTSQEVFLSDFFTLLAVERCRRQYRDECEHSEWVDLGGEG